MTPINKNLSCSPLRRATRLGTALVLAGALGFASVAPAMALVNDSGKTITATTSDAQPAVVGDAWVDKVLRPEIGTGWNESVSFQWMRDGVNITDATWFTYRVAEEDIGHKLSIRIIGDDTGKYRDSAQTETASYVPVIASSDPVISGKTVAGSKLTASATAWEPADVKKSYQWKAGGVAIIGATASTFTITPAQAGKAITVTVTGAMEFYRATSVTSAPTAVVTLPNVVNTGAPTVRGNTAIGQVLTGTPGTWLNVTDYVYQWLADGAAVQGANAATYTIPHEAVGKKFSLQVTGKKEGYNGVAAVSAQTAPVTANTIANKTAPVITGTTAQDSTLTASTGSWTPSTVALTYQWFAEGQPIPGATAKTFRLTAAQVGKKISVEVKASMAGYTSTAVRSAETGAVLIPSVAGWIPKLTGSAEVGKALTADVGVWTKGATLKYQWLANGQWINGATGTSYKLTQAEIGKKITITVTGSMNGLRTYARTSAATTAVTDLVVANTAAPVLSGSRTKTSTLTVTPGTWGPGEVKLSYQWLRNGQSIAGATATSYKLTAADVGQRVTVKVAGTQAGYAPFTYTAPEGKPVADLYVTNSETIRLSGYANVGSTLRVWTGTWTPGATVTTQWYANGVAIPGATSYKYTPVLADVGKRITATVTGRKADHVTRTITTVNSGKVTYGWIKSVTPSTVSGSLYAGSRLTAVQGSWDVMGLTLSYQWLRNGTPIPGATWAAYDLTAADIDSKISVQTTAAKASWRSVTTASAETGVIKKTPIVNTGAPAIAGSSKVGGNLYTTGGTWNVKPSLRYQWYADGKVITGAIRSSYTPSYADAGKSITVKVSASKTGYTGASVVSGKTAPVTK